MRSSPALAMALTLALSLTLVLPAPDTSAADPRWGTARTVPDNALLPNLRMMPLFDWHIERDHGRRLLRFTTTFVNVGDGPMELVGSRPDLATPEMPMDQVVHLATGAEVRLRDVTTARYAGDGHDHWHAQEVSVYEMWLDTDPTAVRRGAKINFCFFDDELVYPDMAESDRPTYRFSGCGWSRSLQARVGLAVGWSDVYEWDFAYQWIDITELSGGIYYVRATVDQQNRFAETNNVDNCAWARIRFGGSRGGDAVEILDTGEDCGVAAALPVRTFPGATEFSPPRWLRLAAGRHTSYLLNSVGTQLGGRSYTLRHEVRVQVSRRANPVGQPGTWYYVAAGIFRGGWIAAGPGVSLEP